MVSHVCSIHISSVHTDTLKLVTGGFSETFVIDTSNLISVTGCMVSCQVLTAVTGFDHVPVHMGSVVDKVALGQACLRVLQFSPVSMILPVLHIHCSVTDAM